jgi:hypothetical protein
MFWLPLFGRVGGGANKTGFEASRPHAIVLKRKARLKSDPRRDCCNDKIFAL